MNLPTPFSAPAHFKRIYIALTRIKSMSMQNMEPDLARKAKKLSSRQMDALRFTRQLMVNHPGGISLTLLAEHLKITVPAASVLVDTLIKVNLMERAQNPSDRRFVCIRLSVKGEELVNAIIKYMDETITDLMEPLSPEEQRVLAKISRILHQHAYPDPHDKSQNDFPSI